MIIIAEAVNQHSDLNQKTTFELAKLASLG